MRFCKMCLVFFKTSKKDFFYNTFELGVFFFSFTCTPEVVQLAWFHLTKMIFLIVNYKHDSCSCNV